MTAVDPLIVELKAARLQRGWSQHQLARHARIGRGTVCRVESGTHSPTLVVLRAYAGALGRDITAPEREVTRE